MTNGIKHVLTAQIRALASTSYAIFHIVCPFSHCTHVFHIFVWRFLKLQSICLHFINFSYEWRIFFIHLTIHSILQRKLFIQQIIHSKKIWNYSFKEIIHSFEKWISPTSETGMIFFNFVSKFSKVHPGDHKWKWAKVQTFIMFWGILFNCLKFIDYLFNCLEFIHLLC